MSDSLSINRLVPGLMEQAGIKTGASPKLDSGEKADFVNVFSNLINSVNDLQSDSSEIQQSFLAGEPVELHQVMIKAEEAGVAMDLLLEIRNKLVDAYNDIIKMPV
jgi:flagellar hook-basal body complex protein FliE